MPYVVYKDTYLDLSQVDGVDPTGVNECGSPLQAGLTYAWNNGLVAAMPRGTRYLSSVNLSLMGIPASANIDATINNGQIVGTYNNGGARPVIIAAAGLAPDSGTKEALLHMGVHATNPPTAVEAPDWSWNGIIRNVDLEAQSNNAGLILLHADSSQYSNLRDLRLDATNCYAGFAGGSGPGGYNYNIEVIGGVRGILHRQYLGGNAAGQATYFRKIRLVGQSELAFLHWGIRGCAIDGLEIVDCPPTAFILYEWTNSAAASAGHLCLRDVKCEWDGAAGVFIDNDQHEKIVTMLEVYLTNCSKVVDNNGSAKDIAGVPGQTLRVEELVYTPTNTYSNSASGATITATTLVNGVAGAAVPTIQSTISPNTIPSDLVSKHTLPELYDPWMPGVVDAYDFGARANDTGVDSYLGIQAALDHANATGKKAVWLRKPNGVYYLSASLTLNGDAHLIGNPGMAWLYARDSMISAIPAGERRWMIETSEDQYGASWVHDIGFDHANNWGLGTTIAANRLGAFRWRQGRNSGCGVLRWMRLPMTRYSIPRHVYEFVSWGGGTHLGISDITQIQDDEALIKDANYRKLYINRSATPDRQEPLQLLLNLEQGGDGQNTSAPLFAEIIDAQKVMILSSKYEIVGSVFRISGSSKVAMYYNGVWSPGNNAGERLANFMEVVYPAEVTAHYIYKPAASAGTPGSLVLETNYGARATITRNSILSYYRTGTPFNRAAMFEPLLRPNVSSIGFESPTWYLSLESVSPIGAVALARLQTFEAEEGTDSLPSAALSSSSGSGLSNLLDSDGSTLFSASTGVSIEMEWIIPKALKEMWLTAPADVNLAPHKVQVWCVNPDTGRVMLLYEAILPTWLPGETRVLRMNRRGALLGMRGRVLPQIKAMV